MQLSISTLIAKTVAAAGAGISAYSAYSQGQAQSRMAEYNALIARQNAELASGQMDIAKKEKDIMEARLRRRTEQTLASQRAGFAKAGVEPAGTPLIVAAGTITEADLDAMAIRYAATIERGQILAQQAGLKQEERLQRMAGRQYQTAGYLGAGASLLSGIGQVASIYYSGKK